MGHHNDELVFGDFPQKIHDLHAGCAVKCPRRLIGKQNIRVIDKRAGNGNALHLPAGHLTGLFVQLISKTDFSQRLVRALSPLLF